MKTPVSPSVLRFYTDRSDGLSVADRWKTGAPVGSRIVPSIYVEGYKNLLADLIVHEVSGNEDATLLSIGSGVGLIECEMIARGYRNLVSIDVIEEFVAYQRSLGIEALVLNGHDVRSLDRTFECIYMDGCLGHLATSFHEPLEGTLSRAFAAIRDTLDPAGCVVTSDDPPYGPNRFEIHDEMEHLRFSDEALRTEITRAGFRIASQRALRYDRPRIGGVDRRILVLRRV